jgi:Xaa-Pro aminopeptidase
MAEMDHSSRLQELERMLVEQELDGFMVTHPANLRYLCGFTGSNGLLLFLAGRRVFLTDGRYTQQAHQEVRGARVVIAKEPLVNEAAKLITKLRSAAVGFESDYTTVSAADSMRKLVHGRIEWQPAAGLVMRQRIIKDAEELKLIAAAVKLGAAVYEHAREFIQPGVPESEVAGEMEYAARQAGADGMSFETIVAAGKRSALPHGRASSQPIPRRGFVVVDSGVILRGYCSDLTRTVHVGRLSRQERKWYETVLQAQVEGIAAVAPGKTGAEVDQAARAVLHRAGLDRYFTHSTGHGVGLEVHEPPRLARQQPGPPVRAGFARAGVEQAGPPVRAGLARAGVEQIERLAPGMVVTIEPGIYLPGKGGIRIEDMVVVTARGSEVLTPVTKELVEL